MDNSPDNRPTSPFLVLLAWVIIGVPWLWGIVETADNAAKLFE